MPDKTPCLDCTALVGAGPLREAHGALLPAANDSQGKPDVFRCETCGCRWAVARLGWSRLVD